MATETSGLKIGDPVTVRVARGKRLRGVIVNIEPDRVDLYEVDVRDDPAAGSLLRTHGDALEVVRA
jgi:hypothetical protein